METLRPSLYLSLLHAAFAHIQPSSEEACQLGLGYGLPWVLESGRYSRPFIAILDHESQLAIEMSLLGCEYERGGKRVSLRGK